MSSDNATIPFINLTFSEEELPLVKEEENFQIEISVGDSSMSLFLERISKIENMELSIFTYCGYLYNPEFNIKYSCFAELSEENNILKVYSPILS